LAHLDDRVVHDPDAFDARPQSYPAKRVGHREARERALAAYRQSRV
jgi:deoxyribodipyrimidine photo-lyase